jgi:hypothetical protein
MSSIVGFRLLQYESNHASFVLILTDCLKTIFNTDSCRAHCFLVYRMQVEKLSTELDATKDQLAASAELQSERDELERRLRDAEEKSSKLPIAQDQSIPVDGLKELQSENRALQHQLKDSEEDRNQFQNELQETRMELNGLKQNLEEAERIELQNEDLVAKLKSMSDELAVVENLREQLKANEYDVRIKDQLVRYNNNMSKYMYLEFPVAILVYELIIVCFMGMSLPFCLLISPRFADTTGTQDGVGERKGHDKIPEQE